MNEIHSAHGVATAADKFVVTPNSDTPYSFLWMDLRAEPLVVTMPAIEKKRYYSAQIIDLYTFNAAYLGTRAYGNDGGAYLIAGPRWKGATPKGVKAVIHLETELAYVLFRTQLFDPADLPNVDKIQAGYEAEPLSKFLGKPAPPAAPAIDWPKPAKAMLSSPELFGYLDFLLRFCPAPASEKALRAPFAKLGIGGNEDPGKLSSEQQTAVGQGIADAWGALEALQKDVNADKVSSTQFFGTREFLKSNYLYRFAGAKLGLYGNSGAEAIYLAYFVDAKGQVCDGSKAKYVLRFPKGGLPPAKAFWSLTMYDGKTQFLVANPLNRYLLNSPMLDQFKHGDDGSLTFYVQKDSPGADEESNWLPAPDGPFYVVLRIYMPGEAVVKGTWKKPPLEPVP
jgi:hypothetical protein